jgi:hypothetical protein
MFRAAKDMGIRHLILRRRGSSSAPCVAGQPEQTLFRQCVCKTKYFARLFGDREP